MTVNTDIKMTTVSVKIDCNANTVTVEMPNGGSASFRFGSLGEASECFTRLMESMKEEQV